MTINIFNINIDLIIYTLWGKVQPVKGSEPAIIYKLFQSSNRHRSNIKAF